ncbi:cyclic nucleotide-gated ion channel 1 [Rosa sericea]
MENKEISGENIVVSVRSSLGNVDGIERQDPVTRTPIRKAWARVSTLVVEICSKAVELDQVSIYLEFILCWTLAVVIVPFVFVARKWKRVFILSCVAVSFDCLFLYIPIIDQEYKCLGMDKTLRNVALVLRSLTDIAFILHILLLIVDEMDEGPQWDDSNSEFNYPAIASRLPRPLKAVQKAIAKKMPWLSISIIVNFLAILPIPQVAIVVGFFRLGGSKHFLKQTIINVFLVFQYFLRVSQIFLSIKKVDVMVGKWVKGSFYFLLYIIASHVLAAFWYFFSIQRETSCWNQACRTIAGCMPKYDCGHSFSLNSTLINKLCPIDNPNATLFNFGMFLDILQSGNTGSTNFSTKFFYSFWWGLRNLSNFGTNLETSSYMWENCFAILICVIGLLLFLFLIGNLQTYIQSEAEKFVKIEESRRTRITTKYKDIWNWMSSHGIPNNMINDMLENIREDRIVQLINKDVDTKFMGRCYNRDKAESDPVKFVCLNALKQIPILRNMDEQDFELFWQSHYDFPNFRSLRNMDEQDLELFLQDRRYGLPNYTTKEKDSYITRAGKDLEAIYLIIDGVVECKDAKTTGSSPMSTQTMRYYDCCVEEVLRWAISNYKRSRSDRRPLPVSKVDVKCQTKIEAFKFTANRLIKILQESKYPVHLEELAHDGKTDHRIKSATTDAEEKVRQKIDKQNDILAWLMRYGLPEDLKANIMNSLNKSNLVEENMDVDLDVDFMFAILPENIKPSIKHHLGMNSLKKVPMLQKMHEYVLEIIINHLEPVVYKKNSHVVGAGEPLGLMIFILGGKVIMTDPTRSNATKRSSPEITDSSDENVLEMGDYYGEELLSWASPNNISSSDNLVISTRDVKCETKVEALILKAEDLKSAVSKCGSQWNFNNCMNSQQMVDDGRDRVAHTVPTSAIEETIRLHQGHDIILEQLVLIRETIFRRLDDQGRKLDDQGRKLDDMAAFLARVGYTGITGTSSTPSAP